MILLIYPKGKHRVLLCRNNSVLFTGKQYLFAIFDIETVCSTVLADLRMYFCTKDFANRYWGEHLCWTSRRNIDAFAAQFRAKKVA